MTVPPPFRVGAKPPAVQRPEHQRRILARIAEVELACIAELCIASACAHGRHPLARLLNVRRDRVDQMDRVAQAKKVNPFSAEPAAIDDIESV